MAGTSGRTQIPIWSAIILFFYISLLFVNQSDYFQSELKDSLRSFFASHFLSGKHALRAVFFGIPLFLLAALPAFADAVSVKMSFLYARISSPVSGRVLVVASFLLVQAGWLGFRIAREKDIKITPGKMAMINLQLFLLPVSRASPLLKLMRLDPASFLEYHRNLGWISLLFVALHGLMHIIHWLSDGGAQHCWKQVWSWEGSYPIRPGVLASITLITLSAFSNEKVRRSSYHVFLAVHRICALMFLLFAFEHYPGMVWWTVGNLVIYFADKASQLRSWLLPSNVLHARYKAGVLSLRLPCSPPPEPLQWMSIQASDVSAIAWHPFTIASFTKDTLTLCIKVNPGKWTEGLLKYTMAANAPWLRVSNYYGNSMEDYEGAQLCMVAGGSGGTSFSALIKHLLRTQDGSQALELVWVCRSESELHEYLLNTGLAKVIATCPTLNVRFFITNSPSKLQDNSGVQDVQEREGTMPSDLWVSPEYGRALVVALCHLFVPAGAIVAAAIAGNNELGGGLWFAFMLLGAVVGALVANGCAALLLSTRSREARSIEGMEMGSPLGDGKAPEEGLAQLNTGNAKSNVEWNTGRPEAEQLNDIISKFVKRADAPVRILASGPPALVSATKLAADGLDQDFESFSFEL